MVFVQWGCLITRWMEWEEKNALLEGLESFFQPLRFLRCYVRKLWSVKESRSVSKASSFFCNALKECEENGPFPQISSVWEPCSKALWRTLCSSRELFFNIHGYQDNRRLFQQAPDFLCVHLCCYFRHVKWPENGHSQQDDLWQCPLRSGVLSVTAALSLCSSEKSLLAAQNNNSFRWCFCRYLALLTWLHSS